MTTSTSPTGDLIPIEKCKLHIPNAGTIVMNNLPDISDTKQAIYNNLPIMGRSFPLYTYSHSGDRVISLQMHFFLLKEGDAERNLSDLRKIQSAVYPRDGGSDTPYIPPVICTLECGDILSKSNGGGSGSKGTGPLCVIMQNYSVKFPTDVAWDETTMCPYRFDVDTSWYVVYTSQDLPNADRIISSGR